MDDSNPEQRMYRRVAASLREEIASGLRAPGSKLPPIATLCKLHGFSSRRTAQKALELLEGERLIYREPGLGYFVAVHRVHNE